MNLNQFKGNICRICLGDNVCFDWNTTLYKFFDTTYKDCYYKYCQLECNATDPFPQMLCKACSNALQCTHVLILKALKSHKRLQIELKRVEEQRTSTINSNFAPAEFETVLIEKNEEPVIELGIIYQENSDAEINGSSKFPPKSITACEKEITEAKTAQLFGTKKEFKDHIKPKSNNSREINASPIKTKRKCTSRMKREKIVEDNTSNIYIENQTSAKEKLIDIESIKIEIIHGDVKEDVENSDGKAANFPSKSITVCEKKKTKEFKDHLNHRSNNFLKINASPIKTKRKCTSRMKAVKIVKDNTSNIYTENQTSSKEKLSDCKSSKNEVRDSEVIKEEVEKAEFNSNVKKKYIRKDEPRMCSLCSKILVSKYAVEMHEKTHIENRERKETCKVCALKFFDKRNLYSHMRIHKENREKRHKCDFCSKAFYDKGGLNIHRRIHLGQMVPCSLCSKQFFRQIDLDRHMTSHSAKTINCDDKKKSRYFVRCEYCDKSILSTSFRSHTAAHLNEPLMKCTICDKEYFRRRSCVLHVRKVHQKTNEEYNDFILIYKKNRISHLFLEQNANMQVNNDI